MTDSPTTSDSDAEELEHYFLETIARYTNSPGIPELAGIMARYVTNWHQSSIAQAEIKARIKECEYHIADIDLDYKNLDPISNAFLSKIRELFIDRVAELEAQLKATEEEKTE